MVRIQEDGDDWCRVECSYRGKAYSGFMVAKFLAPCDAPDSAEGADDGCAEQAGELEVRIEEIERLLADLSERLSVAGL